MSSDSRGRGFAGRGTKAFSHESASYMLATAASASSATRRCAVVFVAGRARTSTQNVGCRTLVPDIERFMTFSIQHHPRRSHYCTYKELLACQMRGHSAHVLRGLTRPYASLFTNQLPISRYRTPPRCSVAVVSHAPQYELRTPDHVGTSRPDQCRHKYGQPHTHTHSGDSCIS